MAQPPDPGAVPDGSLPGLKKVIEAHGHAFQYACLHHARTLFDGRLSAWRFEASEFPVSVRDESTRIDFVLRHAERPFYLLAECKRTNPSYSRWAFARAPLVRSGRSYEPLLVERVDAANNELRSEGREVGLLDNRAFHHGYELKTNATGESGHLGRGAIEETASQVSRGLSGMVNFFKQHPRFLGSINSSREAYLLPVIFTTAELFATDANLDSADRLTGTLHSEPSVERVDWLALQYHLSPGIKHDVPTTQHHTIGEMLDALYVRTVLIVTAKGMQPFLTWLSHTVG